MDATHVSVQGVEVPAVGLGTWRLTGEECRETVETALDLGYRHVDTAQAYGNERAVGAALRASDVDRDELFLTTKLHGQNRSYDDVLRSTDESLARLDTGYVDLLLIHQPTYNPLGPSHAETLRAMNDLVDAGKVRHVGVSNFGVERLHDARTASSRPLLTDQVQFNPFWDQRDLLDYCAIHDVLVTAYSPLGHGGVLDDPVLSEIGESYGKTPAQVAIRWVLQHDPVVAIPKATGRDHLAQNLDVFDFRLTDDEVERIRRPSKLRSLARSTRAYLRA